MRLQEKKICDCLILNLKLPRSQTALTNGAQGVVTTKVPNLLSPLCCVGMLDLANPPCPLMFPKSIPRGRPSLEDRL
jgi:hypothetical protein